MRDGLPPSVRLEECGCAVGCPPGEVPVLEGRDRLHGLPGRFTVVRCRTCGLMRTNPRPTQDTIGFYYPDDYGPHRAAAARSATPSPPRARPLWRRAARFLWPTVDDRALWLPDLRPGRLLEVGCASGSFLARMAARGWAAEGIELSPRAAAEARALGHRVHAGPIETAPDYDEPFDLIVGFMVLEHLHDPVHALRRLRGWIKPGGSLVLSVPNCGSLEFRVFGDAWYALQVPCHLSHFTPRTLRLVLERGGFASVQLAHQRVLGNLAASLGYLLEDRGHRNRASRWLVEYPVRAASAERLLAPFAWLLSVLGQTGRMTVWARPA